jgi:hypothetical protein
MAAPASAPPALPPDTAEPIRAPAPAPNAPPASAFDCCGVSHADTKRAAASATERARTLFTRCNLPVSSPKAPELPVLTYLSRKTGRWKRLGPAQAPQSHDSGNASMNKQGHLFRPSRGKFLFLLDRPRLRPHVSSASRPDGRRLKTEESPGSMRIRRRITSGGGDPRESATESKPPDCRPQGRKAGRQG